ncbi:hypothetical protein F4778DRAFT_154258 [Xylariomycetidae sp. FL2044]|nr:hypothetical protein F4778DRAFT_154258 [Xylariomycetidae sp. FL2044]
MSLPRFIKSSNYYKPPYDELHTSEADASETLLKDEESLNPGVALSPPASNPQSTLRRVLALATRTLVILLALWGFLSLLPIPLPLPFRATTTTSSSLQPSGQQQQQQQQQQQHQHQEEDFAAPTYPSCSCGGTTVAEARRRGCIFTPLAIAWLPPHCVDVDLAAEFDRQGPGPDGAWDYWSDVNQTRRLSREEVGMLADKDGGVFYATQDWHVVHCVYTWMKHYRSRWTGVTIERRSNGLDHIGHCKEVLKIRGDLQDIRTVAGIALDADDPGTTEI